MTLTTGQRKALNNQPPYRLADGQYSNHFHQTGVIEMSEKAKESVRKILADYRKVAHYACCVCKMDRMAREFESKSYQSAQQVFSDSEHLARIYAIHGNSCCQSQMTGISQLIISTAEKFDQWEHIDV